MPQLVPVWRSPYALFSPLPTSSSTRSASRTTASGRPWRFAAAAACASKSGAPAGGRCRAGKALRRQILLLDAPSPARFGKPRRVLQLVVVDAHAAAAPGSPGRPMTVSSATVEAPARPMTRCALAISSGRLAKNVRQMRAHAGGAIGRFDPRQVLLAALLHDEQAGAHLRRQQRQRRRQRVGEEARALAAAEHQQREGPPRARAPDRRCADQSITDDRAPDCR